jgi:O-antigen/teichoic acid export membrane protein
VIELVKQKFKSNKESFQLYLGSSIISVFNFISIALLSHFLVPADYGVFRFILMLVSIAVALGSLGFAQAIYYYLQKSSNAQQGYNYINALRVGMLLSAALVVLLLMGYQYFFDPNASFLDWNRFNIWIILLIIPGIFQSVELNIFLSIHRMGVYFVNTLSMLSIKIALIVIAYTMHASLIHYVFLLSITAVLPSLFNNYYLQSYFKNERFQIHLDLLKEIWRYGLPIGIGLMFGVLMSQADKLVLSFLLKDPESIALISNGNFEVPLITVFYTSFSAIAFPMMLKAYQQNDIKELLNVRYKYQKEVVLLLFPIVVALIAWSPSFISLAFGEYYKESAAFFAVYAITFFLRFNSYHDIFLITNKTKYISIIQGVEMIFHIALTYAFIKLFGLIGASIAAVLTNLIYAFVCIYISKNLLKVRMIDVVPFWYLYKIVFIAAAIMFPFYFLSILFNSDLLKVMLAAFYIVSCILILYKFESPIPSKNDSE